MKKLISFIVMLLISNGYLAAQKPEPMLWQITGNGIQKPSYLFGTSHSASIQLLDRFPKVMQVAQTADFALFEKGGSAIGETEEAEIHSPPLDSVFTKEEYALVDSFFTASPFGSIKPHNNEASLMAMAQAVVMLKQEESKNQDGSFDDIIHTRLEKSGKPTFQLDETGEMARHEKTTDSKMLAQAIVLMIKNDFSESDITPKDHIDVNLYNTKLKQPVKLHQNAPDYVLNETIERHTIWLPKIEQKMKEGSCFIAVGLVHLQFQTGLIQLLRNKGYTLKPVKL